jgi:hypothetical protein
MRNLLTAAAKIYLALGVVWFVGGFVLFPDTPIHACGTAYCGKQGQPHSRSDFEHHNIWKLGLTFGWPLMFVAGLWLNRGKLPNPYAKLNEKRREPFEQHDT